MSGLIISPWEAVAETRRGLPDGFLFGVSAMAPCVEDPGEPPARPRDMSDAWRDGAEAPGFLAAPEADLDRARGLGSNCIHLSVSWARLQPEGRGKLRPDALAAYERLVDASMARGLKPLLSLLHHDVPLDRLGLPLGDLPHRFAEFAEGVAVRLGDRCDLVTMDAPATDDGVQSARAHARAVEAVRAAGRTRIGLSVPVVTALPATASSADGMAARFHEAACTITWLQLAAGRGGTAVTEAALHGADSPRRARFLGETGLPCEPVDFVILRPSPAARVAFTRGRPFDLATEPAAPPAIDALPAIVRASAELTLADAGPRILLESRHEAPASCAEETPDLTTRIVNDRSRQAALEAGLSLARACVARGLPIDGWIASPLLDGFGLARAPSLRSGLMHIDWGTRQRTPKASTATLRALIENA